MQQKWNYLCLKSPDGVFAFSFGSNWFGLSTCSDCRWDGVLINHVGLFMIDSERERHVRRVGI